MPSRNGAIAANSAGRNDVKMAHVPVILVVEGEMSVQGTLCSAFTHVGFTTHAAENIDAALKVLGSEHIDAVSLDVRIPDPRGLHRNGLTLLTFLRATAEYASIPVIIFTGMPLSPEQEAIARTHDAQVFYKPQPYSVLIAHLSRLLESSPAA